MAPITSISLVLFVQTALLVSSFQQPTPPSPSKSRQQKWSPRFVTPGHNARELSHFGMTPPNDNINHSDDGETGEDTGAPQKTKNFANGVMIERRKLFSAAASAAAAYVIPLNSIAFAEDETANSVSSIVAASPLKLPPMGIGAWAWGDSLFWKYDPRQDGDLREVFDYALKKDLAFFDTAELYGLGRSESLLGKFRRESPSETGSKVTIATKFATLPWKTKPSDVVKACRASMSRLGDDKPIDLYQIHFPNAWSNEAYWDGLAQCYELGLVKAVGVSNYGKDALRATHAALAKRGIPLASNQIQLSLLYRWPIENGLLETCKELDVQVLSYSPLALGFLTGKYSKDVLPEGPRKKLGEKLFAEEEGSRNFSNLITVMKDIASNHGESTSVSQVAINWTRAKGTIPIPGARSLKQVKQNLDALSWELSKEELAILDEAASKVPSLLSPEASPFPKEDIGTGLVMFDS